MNFFTNQDQARRRTRWLVILFALAVMTLIVITTVLVTGFIAYSDLQSGNAAVAPAPGSGFTISGVHISWKVLTYTAIITLAVVVLGSLYKIRQLNGGGPAVANALGGRLLQPNTSDPQERQLLNVVEEMAIASGTPVPPVYVLDEPGINAFAAGFRNRDAVIGVTRGCMNLLNRDQLQGVIAHEFSHILNGDMRMNLRITGLLHGILVIGLLGSALARSSAGSATSRRSNRDRNSGGLVLLGLGLLVIGYVGTFFGQLIKAAVSRQREYLADASAVQFTRNPSGISEALQIIGGHVFGSRLSHPGAEQFSHMYFGTSTGSSLASLMATHPPLSQRIRRITPRWNGSYPEVTAQPAPSAMPASGTSGFAGTHPPEAPSEDTRQQDKRTVDRIGTASLENLTLAEQLLAAIPVPLKAAAHEPYTARALIYSLLIQDGEFMSTQWNRLEDHADPQVLAETRKLQPQIAALDEELRLPLFELTMPALKTLSAPQLKRFRANVIALIKADNKADMFEWALYKLLENQLFPDETPPVRPDYSLQQLATPACELLAIICHAGHDNPDDASRAYDAAAQELPGTTHPMLPRAELGLGRLNQAIAQLEHLKTLEKPLLLKALLQAIRHDGRITASEFELFRVIADCLDCPAPPIIH